MPKINEEARKVFDQAGVIPFCKSGSGLEILLITSRRKKRWVIPKGLVEPGLSAAESAAKEALEEAGISGLTGRQIGSYAYEKWGGICRVRVFPLLVKTVHATWEEQDLRERRWFTPADAAALIREPKLQLMIRELPHHTEMQNLLDRAK